MLTRLALIVAFTLCVVSWGVPAWAGVPVCADGHDDDNSDDDKADEPERVVLPCALAETGSGCVDAAIYLVTTGGVFLCQIDIPALQAHDGLPEVEQTPAGTPSSSSSFVATGIPARTLELPPVLVFGAPAAMPDADHGPREGHRWTTSPPS